MLPLCPSKKIEPAIRDAFEESLLNNDFDKDHANLYYLFKKSNLKSNWRLPKRQALFKGLKYIRYKMASGKRWVEHQIDALKSHLHNRLILIGFFKNQIVHPHNAQ